MLTATRKSSRKPATKPARTLHYYDGVPALLEMSIGKESFSYWLEQIPADFGAGFSVRKMIGDGGDVYHVHIDPRTLQSSCDCKGGTYCNHCKHAEAIVALIKSGRITLPQSKPAPVVALEDL